MLNENEESLKEPKDNNETSTNQPSARAKPDVVELGESDKKVVKKIVKRSE